MYRASLHVSVIRLKLGASVSGATCCCHSIQCSCIRVAFINSQSKCVKIPRKRANSSCNPTFPIALFHLYRICRVRISLSKIFTLRFYSSMTFPTLPHTVFHKTVNRFNLNNLFLPPFTGVVVSVLHFLLAVGNVHPVGPGQIRWWNIHFIWHLLSSCFPCSHSYSQSFTVTDRRDLPFHFSRLFSSPYICILFLCTTFPYACRSNCCWLRVFISASRSIILFPGWLRCVDLVFHRNFSFSFKIFLAIHSPVFLIFLKQRR